MMNENAKKWVEALRSGEFQQCKGVLCENDRYCCLGVACKIASRENLIKEEHKITYTTYDDRYRQLPDSVRNWLGLSSNTGEYTDTLSRIKSLSGANDTGSTFDEIADIIESEPQGLFE